MATEKSQIPSPLTGCGWLTLIAGIVFSISILFMKGFSFPDLLFSFIISLLATWILARVISFLQRYFKERTQ